MPLSAWKYALTIITVCLNSAKTIKKTIESVRQQKTDEIEYIIIDGASKDGTQEIVRSYRDVINIFLSEKDQGISDAFNKGIARSSGNIIALLNADDQLLPGAIAKVLRYFQEHPGTEILHGDILLYQQEQFIKRLRPSRFWWTPWRLALFNHPATFVKKNVYTSSGLYDTRYKIAMDVERFIHWKEEGRYMQYWPEALVRMEAGGLSGRSGASGLREKRNILLDNGYNRPLVEIQFCTNTLVYQLLHLKQSLKNS